MILIMMIWYLVAKEACKMAASDPYETNILAMICSSLATNPSIGGDGDRPVLHVALYAWVVVDEEGNSLCH